MSESRIQVSPRGTRGVGFPRPLMKVFKLFAGPQIRMFRRDGGRSMSSRMGFPVVLLTTPPSGVVSQHGQAWAAPPSEATTSHEFSPSRNPPTAVVRICPVLAPPDEIWLEVGKERFKLQGESLEGSARVDALARLAAIAPRYGGYQEKTNREIPVVRLTRELS